MENPGSELSFKNELNENLQGLLGLRTISIYYSYLIYDDYQEI